MRKIFTNVFAAILLTLTVAGQNETKTIDKLKVFIDCSSTWCDMTFIRTEINLVDFMLDRIAADVHVLVTEQGTGSGGRKYQLIFFGQNSFKNLHDTIHFNTDPNSTDFERRDMLIKYMKLGLAPYIAKTKAAKDAVISFKRTETEGDKKDSGAIVKDPWNYWVYRVGVNGHYEADENYKSSNFYCNLSANRVTEELKMGFELSGGKRRNVYIEQEDSLGNRARTITKRHNYSLEHFLIKSLTEHWSFGYQVTQSRNSFSNLKSQISFRTGFEYAIFPYKEVNTKFFTVSYTVDVRRNIYFDSTLYDKLAEILFGHGVESNLSFNQKWGNISFGLDYHNYLHNWKFFSLGANLELDIRITGGLSFNINSYAELTHDQIFLVKGQGSLLDILTRRRQLASGYFFYTSFGINYRFGSKLNNFVNPRFD